MLPRKALRFCVFSKTASGLWTFRQLSVSEKFPYHKRLPDSEKQAIIDRIIRVDHAGEYAAVRIYEGQLAVLQNTPSASVIRDMKEHEDVHLKRMSELIVERRARPTLLLPFWDVAGFALGAATALLGPRAAMACTVAVEEVITEHYNDQIRKLAESGLENETELKEIIKKFRDEEEEHRQTGLDHEAEQAPLYRGLTAVIKTGCRAAVWVAERV